MDDMDDEETFNAESASTQYSDFVGTVAMDDMSGFRSLVEAAGLNPDEWSLQGVEVSLLGHRWESPDRPGVRCHIHLYVIRQEDRDELTDESAGRVYVRKVHVDDPTGEIVTRCVLEQAKMTAIEIVRKNIRTSEWELVVGDPDDE